MAATQAAEACAKKLYRDCLRVCFHIGGNSAKGQALRTTVRGEFRKNMGETDPLKITELKMAAVRGLSNYLTLDAGAKDPRIAANLAAQKARAKMEAEAKEAEDLGKSE